MKTLIVLNDPAYGSERSYDGLRLAHALAKREGEQVHVFLLADAVTCALAGQQTPNGYYKSDSAAPAWTLAPSTKSSSSPAPIARRSKS